MWWRFYKTKDDYDFERDSLKELLKKAENDYDGFDRICFVKKDLTERRLSAKVELLIYEYLESRAQEEILQLQYQQDYNQECERLIYDRF